LQGRAAAGGVQDAATGGDDLAIRFAVPAWNIMWKASSGIVSSPWIGVPFV
jgi:hypothetical protein